ncbi:hypothetical protein ERS044041_02222, partial [Streptococcus pneumoniae]
MHQSQQVQAPQPQHQPVHQPQQVSQRLNRHQRVR